MKTLIMEQERTLIRITPKDFPIPKNLLQGSHEQGFLIKGDTIIPWKWYGFTVKHESRYIYTDAIALTSLDILFTADQKTALYLLKTLAEAFNTIAQHIPTQTITSFICLQSLFFTPDGGVLLLPSSIRDLIESSQEDKELFESKVQWTNPKLTGKAAIPYQLTTMAYAIMTNKESPVGPERVRKDGYYAAPIKLYNADLDPQVCSWFAARLGRNPIDDTDLSAWISSFDQMINHPTTVSSSTADTNTARESFIMKQEKRANRKEYLRIHSTRNIIIGIILTIGIAFGVSMIKSALEPPLTAGMNAEEVVEFYYDCHNRLDSVSMGDALAKGVKDSSESTLSYLYVTTSVRKAYEGNSGFIPAPEWVKSGKPQVDRNTLIYGITDLVLTWLDEDTIEASYTLWNPVLTEEDEERLVPAKPIKVVEDLDLLQKKDSWLITAIHRISPAAAD